MPVALPVLVRVTENARTRHVPGRTTRKGRFRAGVPLTDLGIPYLLLGMALVAMVIALVLQVRHAGAARKRSQAPAVLMAIAESTVDAIFAKDSSGRYLLISSAGARFVGRPPDDVVGRDDHALFPAQQAEQLMAADRRIRSTGETEVREEVLNTPEGRRVFHALKGPLRDADGRIFGTYGISRDITEPKLAEIRLIESQERLRTLVDHAPAALAMFDRELRYLEVSQRWRDDYGLSSAQVIGRLHYDVFPEMPEWAKKAHQRGLAGETLASEENSLVRADGTVQWQRWEVHPWRQTDGEVGGILVFTEDITRRKLADLEMKQRNQELERFNRAATERELRMIALKREVNDLARLAGRPAPYDIAFAEACVEETLS